MPTPWIGIDVCRDFLDVAFGSQGAYERLPNSRQGFLTIMQASQSGMFGGVACESTGIYHRGVLEFMHDHDCAISIIQPLFSKRYRESGFNLAKTDKLDARLLARYGEERRPKPAFAKSCSQRELTDILASHREHVAAKVQAQNRLRDAYATPFAQEMRRVSQLFHAAQIPIVDAEIARVIASDPVLAARDAQLQSVPAIALITSATILVGLPELGLVNRKKIGAIVGVVPYPIESGTRKRHGFVRGGRMDVRSSLVFAARSNRADPIVKARRQQFLETCDSTPEADIATAHWLLTTLNAMMRENLTWEELNVVKAARVA